MTRPMEDSISAEEAAVWDEEEGVVVVVVEEVEVVVEEVDKTLLPNILVLLLNRELLSAKK